MSESVIEVMKKALRESDPLPPRDSTADAMVRAALAAAEEAGWVLVPKMPTEEMLEVGAGNAGDWRAMLEKAPKP